MDMSYNDIDATARNLASLAWVLQMALSHPDAACVCKGYDGAAFILASLLDDFAAVLKGYARCKPDPDVDDEEGNEDPEDKGGV